MPQRFKTAGLVTGLGSVVGHRPAYQVYFIAGDFSHSFNRPKKNDFVALYFEPQFNFTKTVSGPNIEFGSNVGIRNYIKIKPRLFFYQMIGTGPHYISARLKVQATGFIFSDNLFVGMMAGISRDRFLNLQFGVRHISNASLKQPNAGVNTFNVRVGISKRSEMNIPVCAAPGGRYAIKPGNLFIHRRGKIEIFAPGSVERS